MIDMSINSIITLFLLIFECLKRLYASFWLSNKKIPVIVLRNALKGMYDDLMRYPND